MARLLAEIWGFTNPRAAVVCGRCGGSVPDPSSVANHIQDCVKTFRKQTAGALANHFAEVCDGYRDLY